MEKVTIFAALFYAIVLSGCAAVSGDSGVALPGLAVIGVEYEWSSESKCVYVSPEIKLSGVPDETTHLRFRLDDLDKPMNNHGGGTIAYDGSTVIAKGAVHGIRGPCPPVGESHRYVLNVVAMDASKNKVASGSGTAHCCD